MVVIPRSDNDEESRSRLSFPWKRESTPSSFFIFWIPVFTGMTYDEILHFGRLLSAFVQDDILLLVSSRRTEHFNFFFHHRLQRRHGRSQNSPRIIN
jgi:hypothetical protein